jgi:ribonuclease T1
MTTSPCNLPTFGTNAKARLRDVAGQLVTRTWTQAWTQTWAQTRSSTQACAVAAALILASVGGVALAKDAKLEARPELQGQAKASASQTATLPTVALSALPKQARDTHALILSGGPYPYAKDGSTFGNRERILPREKRGYYQEFTVKTPGSRDRGARRIVCGGFKAAAVTAQASKNSVPKPDTCFYTDDHYSSFRQITP